MVSTFNKEWFTIKWTYLLSYRIECCRHTLYANSAAVISRNIQTDIIMYRSMLCTWWLLYWLTFNDNEWFTIKWTYKLSHHIEWYRHILSANFCFCYKLQHSDRHHHNTAYYAHSDSYFDQFNEWINSC